jgi:thioredoxin-related protein
MTHRALNVYGLSVALLLFVLHSLPAVAADSDHFFALNTGDLKAELADARAEGKKALLVFFEQEGCPGCRHMKQNVFNRKDVQDYYQRNFTSLAVDIHSSVALKDLAGRELSEKGYAQSLKVRATPTFVFYDLSGAEVTRIVGPLQTAEEFLLLGHFIASGAYRTRTFAQYKLEKPLRKGT